LTPGDYALVVGRQPLSEWDIPLGIDSAGVAHADFIAWLGGSSFFPSGKWQQGVDGLRFLINGETASAVPEPANEGLVSGLFLVAAIMVLHIKRTLRN